MQPAQNRKQFTQKKKKMSSSSKPNSSRGKTIALISSNKCKYASSAEMLHRDVLCISIMRFLCEQATLWNSSEICFIFFFWNQFSARCRFRVCQRQRAYRRPSRGGSFSRKSLRRCRRSKATRADCASTVGQLRSTFTFKWFLGGCVGKFQNEESTASLIRRRA